MQVYLDQPPQQQSYICQTLHPQLNYITHKDRSDEQCSIRLMRLWLHEEPTLSTAHLSNLIHQVTSQTPLLWLWWGMTRHYIPLCPCQAAFIKGTGLQPCDKQTHTRTYTHKPWITSVFLQRPLFYFVVYLVCEAFHSNYSAATFDTKYKTINIDYLYIYLLWNQLLLL